MRSASHAGRGGASASTATSATGAIAIRASLPAEGNGDGRRDDPRPRCRRAARPVCLIEKSQAAIALVGYGARADCAAEGLVSPCAAPITIEATTIAGAPPHWENVANEARPPPQAVSAIWLTRAPPNRVTSEPASSETPAPTA